MAPSGVQDRHVQCKVGIVREALESGSHRGGVRDVHRHDPDEAVQFVLGHDGGGGRRRGFGQQPPALFRHGIEAVDGPGRQNQRLGAATMTGAVTVVVRRRAKFVGQFRPNPLASPDNPYALVLQGIAVKQQPRQASLLRQGVANVQGRIAVQPGQAVAVAEAASHQCGQGGGRRRCRIGSGSAS